MVRQKIQNILNKEEIAIIKKLNTPIKIQNFLDSFPFNFETLGETYRSPRAMLKAKRVHCFEGAIFASLCLEFNGYKNFLMDLKVKASARDDQDHTLCLFKTNGFWGAISKTNHSVLRWRDPIYKSPREIALSYFHEYFLNDGEKTLYSYSKPFDIFKKIDISWVVAEEDLDRIAEALDKSPHLPFVPEVNKKFIRKTGKTEIKGAAITEWNKNGKRV